MNRKVRVRCGRCRTVNVAAEEEARRLRPRCRRRTPVELMATAADATDRLRPPAAQGGRALHPRPGPLRRRRAAARDAARRAAAQPVAHAADRLDRRVGGAGAPQGPRGDHRADLEARGLAWMPTMSDDTQAVLATDKVRFQGQEVAFVVADDRYSRARRARADRRRVRAAAGGGRPGRGARPRRAGDPRRRPRTAPTTTSSTGRPATRRPPTRVFAARRRGRRAGDARSRARTRRRWRPAARWPTSTGSSAKLTLWCTTQAPHAHRTLYAQLTGLPEHRIRVDLAGRRRRLRQQGAGVPGLRLRDRRRDRRPAGRSSGWRTAPRT